MRDPFFSNRPGFTGHGAFERQPCRQAPLVCPKPVYVAKSRTRMRIRGSDRETILIRIHSSSAQPEFIRVAYSRAPADFSSSLKAGRNGFRSGLGARPVTAAKRPPGRQLVKGLVVLIGLASIATCSFLLATLIESRWFE